MTVHRRGDGIGGCFPFKTGCGLWVGDFLHEPDHKKATCQRRGCRGYKNERQRMSEFVAVRRNNLSLPSGA